MVYGDVKSIRIAQEVDGGTGALTEKVDADATIERVALRSRESFTASRMRAWPFVETKSGDRQDLVELVGQDLTIINDDDPVFPIQRGVQKGELIGVKYDWGGEGPGDLVADFTLDRSNGTEPAPTTVEGLDDLIIEVFG